jgi:hypothetical protein
MNRIATRTGKNIPALIASPASGAPTNGAESVEENRLKVKG